MDREGFYHRDGEAVLNEQKTLYEIMNISKVSVYTKNESP